MPQTLWGDHFTTPPSSLLNAGWVVIQSFIAFLKTSVIDIPYIVVRILNSFFSAAATCKVKGSIDLVFIVFLLSYIYMYLLIY